MVKVRDINQDTQDGITSQQLTTGIQPEYRIVITANPSDLWANLCSKSALDKGDPDCLEEIGKRINVYCQATVFFKELFGTKNPRWFEIKISHAESNLKEYHDQLIENDIFPYIPPLKSVTP